MIKDLMGQVHGRLTVLSFVEVSDGTARWLCRCECGVEIVLSPEVIRRGFSSICGCTTIAYGRNGRTDHPLFPTWAGMLHRCYNDSSPAFRYYGARGIKVCERWQDFDAFVEDMGDRPEGATLDREKNNGNYEPENCRWATALQQARNTRANRPLTMNGETKLLTDWADDLGMSYTTLWSRLKRGWTVEAALTEKKRHWGRGRKGLTPQRHMPGVKEVGRIEQSS